WGNGRGSSGTALGFVASQGVPGAGHRVAVGAGRAAHTLLVVVSGGGEKVGRGEVAAEGGPDRRLVQQFRVRLATQRGDHHRCTTRACSATHWAACSCQEKRCAVQYTNSPAARARAVNCW